MKYFSMFSGIGGFEYGIEKTYRNKQSTKVKQNWERGNWDSNESKRNVLLASRATPFCVGFSEIDQYATAIYLYHFPTHKNFGDATRIDPDNLPNFDLLCGGFPCQAFSIAGKRGGFEDTRGTLFFEIARIARIKRPQLLLLENVKGLLSHDHGRTFGTILTTLSDMGYFCEWQVLNSKDFGVPQNRERVFIIGHLGGGSGRKIFPVFYGNEASTKLCGQQNLTNCIKARYEAIATGSYVIERQLNAQGINVQGMGGRKGFKKSDTAGTLKSIYYKGVQSAGTPAVLINQNKKTMTPFGTSQDQKISHVDGLSQSINAGHFNQPKIIQANNPSHSNDRVYEGEGISPSLNTMQGGRRQPKIMKDNMRVRRLTPTECERLQAFPDGWTKYGNFGEEVREISDSQRYKCLGNAVTSSVITAIMVRILERIRGRNEQ